ASAVFGVGNDTTHVTGVLNYYRRNDIFQHDRAYSNIPPFLSSNASPYNLSLSSDVAAAAGGANLNPGGTEFAAAPDLTNGLAPASAYKYGLGRLNHFNFNMTASSFPSSERYGGYLAADHKIFGDQMVLYADGYYENVQVHNEAAPPATGNFQTKGQVTLAIPPRSPLGGISPPNTPTLTRLVFRPMPSIPLILSSKSSRALPALAWLTLGIGYSIMRLMPFLQLSASKETNCSMEPGATMPAGATASLRTSRPGSRYPRRALIVS